MDIVKREFEDPTVERPEFTNVKENWALYDTVLVGGGDVGSLDPGWFNTFNAMSLINQHYFFNVRSRSVGLPYCNMDKRDSMAFPMWVDSLGVTFFSPQVESTVKETPYHQDDIKGHVWEADLPRHASVILTIMQDERVKNTVMLVPPGYGPVGGGVGQGDAEETYPVLSNIQNVVKSATSQSVPDIENRYRFPVPLEIPRNGRVQATIKFSAYGRGLLAAMPDPGLAVFGGGADSFIGTIAVYGLQVSLMGRRAVQQRGQYHV